ncbi:MAG: tetratricopeptide repeat protein [Elusimicrobiota bacterium]
MTNADKHFLAAKKKHEERFGDQIVVGLDQLTPIDAKHWGGYCMWRVLWYDPYRHGRAVFDLDKVLAQRPRDVEALALRGRIRRILGDLKGALGDFKKALTISPNHAYARAALAETKMACGEQTSGMQEFARAEKADPKLLWTYIWRASWEMSEEDLEGAERDVAIARGMGHETVIEYILEGLLAMRRRQYKKAIDIYRRANKMDPESPGVVIMQGEAKLRSGDEKGAGELYERAIVMDHDCKVSYHTFLDCGEPPQDERGLKIFDEALKKRPKAAWLYGLRSEILRMPKLAAYRESVYDLEKAVELAPKSSWLMSFLGRGYAQTGRLEKGVECLNKAVELDPKCGWVIAWRGEALRIMGDLKQAISDLTASIRLERRYMYAYPWRGGIFRLLERVDDALDDLDAGMDLHPRYHHTYHQRAIARLYAGMGKLAMQDMEQAARYLPKYAFIMGRLKGREKESARIMRGLGEAVKKNPRDARPLAWRGESLMKLGDWEGAVKDLTAALKRDPEMGWAHAWRGEANFKLGRWAGALADLEEATRLDSTYHRAWAFRGAALYRLGRHKEAIEALDMSMKLDTRSAWAWAWRGEVKLRLGDFEGALADVDKALNFEMNFVEALVWRGDALKGLGRFEEAMTAVNRALELNPDHAIGYITRALIKEKLGDFFGEMLDFARALKSSPDLLDKSARETLRGQLLATAAKALDAGDDKTALTAAEALAGIDPECAQAHAAVCEAKRRLKEEGALEALDKAHAGNEYGVWCYLAGQWESFEDLFGRFESGPGGLGQRTILGPDTYERILSETDRLMKGAEARAWVHGLRGEARFKTGDLAGAVDDLTRALKARPEDAKALAWRGEARYWRGDRKGALADFDKAVALEPGSAWALAWRGQLKLWMGRYKDAAKDFTAALKRDPKHAWSYGWRGASRMCQGDIRKALPDLDRALKLDPRDVEARVWRGEAYRLLGKHERALTDLDEAVRLSPGQFWALLNRFLANQALGRSDQARRDLASASRIGNGRRLPGKDMKQAAAAAERMLAEARGSRTEPGVGA